MADRRIMSDSYWEQPIHWNKIAEKKGERPQSLLFEHGPTSFEDHPHRRDTEGTALGLSFERPPWLDWLPADRSGPENIENGTSGEPGRRSKHPGWEPRSESTNRSHAGATTAGQSLTAKVRFLSMEPLLEMVQSAGRKLLEPNPFG